MNLVCSAFGRDAAHHEDLPQLYLDPNDLGVVQGMMLLGTEVAEQILHPVCSL